MWHDATGCGTARRRERNTRISGESDGYDDQQLNDATRARVNCEGLVHGDVLLGGLFGPNSYAVDLDACEQFAGRLTMSL